MLIKCQLLCYVNITMIHGMYVAILEGGGLSPVPQDTLAWEFSAPAPSPWLWSRMLASISAEAPALPGLWAHQEIDTGWLSSLPSAVELPNCMDVGTASTASFVRAMWLQPCLAERYIHYGDSFYRDFQRDWGGGVKQAGTLQPRGAAGSLSRLLIITASIHLGLTVCQA